MRNQMHVFGIACMYEIGPAVIHMKYNMFLWYIIYISEVGGTESEAPPRKREIVSFRACERRAVLDVGVEWQFKSNALTPFPFPFLPREPFPFSFVN